MGKILKRVTALGMVISLICTFGGVSLAFTGLNSITKKTTLNSSKQSLNYKNGTGISKSWKDFILVEIKKPIDNKKITPVFNPKYPSTGGTIKFPTMMLTTPVTPAISETPAISFEKTVDSEITYINISEFILEIVETFGTKAINTAFADPNSLAMQCCITYTDENAQPIMIVPAKLYGDKAYSDGTPIYLVVLGGTSFEEDRATEITTDILAGYELDNEYCKAVKAAINKNIPKESKIIISGISLGGMVGQQVAADSSMKKSYDIIRVIGFGCGPIMSDEIECEVTRFIDENDLVPRLTVGNGLNLYKNSDNDNPIKEETKYKTAAGAHALGYVLGNEWNKYDIYGNLNGNVSIKLDKSVTSSNYYAAPLTEKLGTRLEEILNESFKNEKYVKGLKEMLSSLKWEDIQEILKSENITDMENLLELAGKSGLTNPNKLNTTEKAKAQKYIAELNEAGISGTRLVTLEAILSSENISKLKTVLKNENVKAAVEILNLIDMDDVRDIIDSLDEEAVVDLVASLTQGNRLKNFVNSIKLEGLSVSSLNNISALLSNSLDMNSLKKLILGIDYSAAIQIATKIDKAAISNIIKVVTSNSKLTSRVTSMSGLTSLLGGSGINLEKIMGSFGNINFTSIFSGFSNSSYNFKVGNDYSNMFNFGQYMSTGNLRQKNKTNNTNIQNIFKLSESMKTSGNLQNFLH